MNCLAIYYENLLECLHLEIFILYLKQKIYEKKME